MISWLKKIHFKKVNFFLFVGINLQINIIYFRDYANHWQQSFFHLSPLLFVIFIIYNICHICNLLFNVNFTYLLFVTFVQMTNRKYDKYCKWQMSRTTNSNRWNVTKDKWQLKNMTNEIRHIWQWGQYQWIMAKANMWNK